MESIQTAARTRNKFQSDTEIIIQSLHSVCVFTGQKIVKMKEKFVYTSTYQYFFHFSCTLKEKKEICAKVYTIIIIIIVCNFYLIYLLSLCVD